MDRKKLNPFTSAVGTGIFVFVVTLIVVWIVFASGFWISDGFKVVRMGSMSIIGLEDSTQLFVDNRKHGVVGESVSANTTVKRLVPGIHSILVAKDGFWPWLKDVTIEENSNLTVAPFLVSRSPEGERIYENDKEKFDAAVARVQGSVLHSVSAKLTSSSGKVAIWVTENSIMAEWLGSLESAPVPFCDQGVCTPIKPILTELASIASVDFYRGRDDVIVVAAQDRIFAIEFDQRGTQNFQPIYKGTAPRFFLNDTNTIIVSDGEFAFSINL